MSGKVSVLCPVTRSCEGLNKRPSNTPCNSDYQILWTKTVTLWQGYAVFEPLYIQHLQKHSSYPDTGYYRHFTPLFQRQQCPIQSLSLWPDTGLSLTGYAKPARFLVFYQYYRQQECDINLIGVSGARQMYKRQMIVKSNGYFHFSLLLFSSVASPCDTVTLAFCS